MSVTFTISGNAEYCRAHGLAGTRTYTCQCVDFPEEGRTCRDCGGTGTVSFEDLPFEVNMANGNARNILAALGITGDLWGSMDGRQLLRAIDGCDPAWAERAHEESGGPGTGQCRVINCGLSAADVAERLAILREIAAEAARREEPVVWA